MRQQQLRFVLCIGFVLLHGTATVAQEPRLDARFAVDFRTTDYDPDLLLPAGQGEIWRDANGLTISYPPANAELRQDTGLYSEFSIRGEIVDRTGAVIGINIARADPMQTYAIPCDVVQRVIAELKSQAVR